jgi:hypothetical protein
MGMGRTAVEDVAVGPLLPKCGSPCFWRCSVADNVVHPVFGLCGMSTVGGAVFYCRDGYEAKVAGPGCL